MSISFLVLWLSANLVSNKLEYTLLKKHPKFWMYFRNTATTKFIQYAFIDKAP